MLNYFSSFLSLAEPIATETAISQGNRVAKKMGINQNVVDVATNAARLAYKGPEKFLAKAVATEQGKALAAELEGYLGDNHEEPTLVSSTVGRLAGLGGFFLSGGGLWGSAVSTLVTKTVEPIVRKAQYDEDMRYYEELDNQIDEYAQEEYERNGFSNSGF